MEVPEEASMEAAASENTLPDPPVLLESVLSVENTVPDLLDNVQKDVESNVALEEESKLLAEEPEELSVSKEPEEQSVSKEPNQNEVVEEELNLLTEETKELSASGDLKVEAQEEGEVMEEESPAPAAKINAPVEGDKAEHDPYFYTNQSHFTSEIYKIEIRRLPKFYGLGELKKLINVTMQLDSNKVKPASRTNRSSVFVCFRSQAEKTRGLDLLNGYRWKGVSLEAIEAKPAKDPLMLKRRNDAARGNAPNKHVKLDVGEMNKMYAAQLKSSTTPYWKCSYEDQLAIKMKDIKKTMNKYGNELAKGFMKFWANQQRLQNDGLVCPIEPFRTCSTTTGYRNRCEFTIGIHPVTKEPAVGFRLGAYAGGDCSVWPADECLHISDIAKNCAKIFQKFVASSEFKPYDPIARSGHFKCLGVRNTSTGQLMIILDFCTTGLSEEQVVKFRADFKDFFETGLGKELNVDSLSLRDLDVQIKRGEFFKQPDLILGQPFIVEKLLGNEFEISPSSFFQVNTAGAEVLYSTIAELADPDEQTTLLDICCGTGTIGISMAKKAGQVLGVEIVKSAVENAKQNAIRNGVADNCDFFTGSAQDALQPTIVRAKHDKIIAVLDPPRPGVGAPVLNMIRATWKIKTLVFVACNFEASYGNLVHLGKQASKATPGDPFVPIRVIPIDMFPYSKQCEVVILLERRSPANLRVHNIPIQVEAGEEKGKEASTESPSPNKGGPSKGGEGQEDAEEAAGENQGPQDDEDMEYNEEGEEDYESYEGTTKMGKGKKGPTVDDFGHMYPDLTKETMRSQLYTIKRRGNRKKPNTNQNNIADWSNQGQGSSGDGNQVPQIPTLDEFALIYPDLTRKALRSKLYQMRKNLMAEQQEDVSVEEQLEEDQPEEQPQVPSLEELALMYPHFTRRELKSKQFQMKKAWWNEQNEDLDGSKESFEGANDRANLMPQLPTIQEYKMMHPNYTRQVASIGALQPKQRGKAPAPNPFGPPVHQQKFSPRAPSPFGPPMQFNAPDFQQPGPSRPPFHGPRAPRAQFIPKNQFAPKLCFEEPQFPPQQPLFQPQQPPFQPQQPPFQPQQPLFQPQQPQFQPQQQQFQPQKPQFQPPPRAVLRESATQTDCTEFMTSEEFDEAENLGLTWGNRVPDGALHDLRAMQKEEEEAVQRFREGFLSALRLKQKKLLNDIKKGSSQGRSRERSSWEDRRPSSRDRSRSPLDSSQRYYDDRNRRDSPPRRDPPAQSSRSYSNDSFRSSDKERVSTLRDPYRSRQDIPLHRPAALNDFAQELNRNKQWPSASTSIPPPPPKISELCDEGYRAPSNHSSPSASMGTNPGTSFQNYSFHPQSQVPNYPPPPLASTLANTPAMTQWTSGQSPWARKNNSSNSF